MTRTMRRAAVLFAALTAGWVLLRYGAMTSGEFHDVVVVVQNPEQPPSRWALRPLPGAEVTAVWWGSRASDPINFHSGLRRCMAMKTVTTGADGHAVFPRWQAAWGDNLAQRLTVASKAGFVLVSEADKRGENWYPGPGLHVMRPSPHTLPGSREVARDSWCRDLP